MDSIRYFKESSKTRLKGLRSAGNLGVRLQQVQHQVALDAGYRSWGALLAADEADRQLAVVMDMEPYLNANGFGPGRYRRTLQQQREDVVEWRAELRASAEHVDEIRIWLVQHISPRKTINRNVDSYGLKGLAERKLGAYLTNGEFIAAAIIAGYPYRRIGGGSPNALFGISAQSLTVLWRGRR